jgi:type VI secretion system Hcp family effector
MGMYWKCKGAKGDASEPGHKEWIKVKFLGFDSGRVVRTRLGKVANREADVGNVSEITIEKDMDPASMHLFKLTCQGHAEDMEIDFTRAGPNKTEIKYVTYKLEHAVITGYSFNSRGDNPTETITVHFKKITHTYFPQDTALKAKGGIHAWFDRAKVKAEGA